MEIHKDLFDGIYKKYKHDMELIKKTQTAFDLCSIMIVIISMIMTGLRMLAVFYKYRHGGTAINSLQNKIQISV